MNIVRNYRFYAAHRNTGIGGKCARLHGHRYGVEVLLEPAYTANGVSIAFEEIDSHIAPVIQSFDHRTLLDLQDPLIGVQIIADSAVVVPFPTSAENMAAHILNLCRATPIGNAVKAVTLQETDSAKVTVTIEDAGSYPTR